MLPRRTKYGYGVGHVLNDLCSALWFTYLLIYFHHVLLFDNSLSGVVLLIGQVADALSTPFVGREADRTDDLPFCTRYGRRKTWHLVGTILVISAFPFIFMGCLGCWEAEDWAQVVYYAPFVIIFQFGWAATQISHLALIPTITQDPHDRTELNAIRYGFTVMSNVVVYSVTWVVLGLDPSQAGLGPEDAPKFRYIVGIVLAIGAMFVVAFHILVKEDNSYDTLSTPSTPPCSGQDPELSSCPADALLETNVPEALPHFRMKAMDWLKEMQFYQVAWVYMGTRLFCNLTQVYVPIYLQDSLQLQQTSVAVIPLVMYISGFLTTLFMKPLNKLIGRKASYLLGACIGCSGCVWVFVGQGQIYAQYLVYPMACLLGAGGSIMLVTSLSLTADLIGPNVESGAFVYGAMSFTDKLSNGLAVMLIQTLNPCVKCCPSCSGYYKDVLSICCGGAALLAGIGVLSLFPFKIGHRSRSRGNRADEESTSQHSETSVPSSDLPPFPLSPEDAEGWQGEGEGQRGRKGSRGGQGKDELTHNNTNETEHSSEEYRAVPQGLRARLPSGPDTDVVI